MHPGWAALAGISAAALAQQGFQGPAEPYEGRFGLYALYGATRCGDRLGDVHRRSRRGLGDVAYRHQALSGLPPGPRAGRCGAGAARRARSHAPPMSRAWMRSSARAASAWCASPRRPSAARQALTRPQFSAHYMIASVLSRGPLYTGRTRVRGLHRPGGARALRPDQLPRRSRFRVSDLLLGRGWRSARPTAARSPSPRAGEPRRRHPPARAPTRSSPSSATTRR